LTRINGAAIAGTFPKANRFTASSALPARLKERERMGLYLITGGQGFIGKHLTDELLGAGHEVRIIDSLVEQAHGGRTAPAKNGAARTNGHSHAVEIIRADIRDRAAIRQALKGVDGVFHLAAEVGVGQSMYEIERYVGANDVGTAVLLEEMTRQTVPRVIVASSMSVYGEGLAFTDEGLRVENAQRSPQALKRGDFEPRGPNGERLVRAPTDEGKRVDLASVYALTKYVQERLVMMIAPTYGIEAVALRLFNVFGPGQTLTNPYTGVLAIFAGRLLAGEPPLVFEDGMQRRDFVHVRDVARAFRLAMEAPDAAGEVVNIGSGVSRTVLDVARALATALGRDDLEPQVLQRSRAGDIRHCFADIGKARLVLGFEPQHHLENALDDLVAWVEKQKRPRKSADAHGELAARGLVL
jgi:dTDP-L-rhamnose 4-epimerase